MRHALPTGITILAFSIAASAQTPAGGEFRVNTYTTARQSSARPAMEPDGDFVVVWESYAQDGNSYGAFGQRFAASGAPRGSEFRINTYTTGEQSGPAAAVGSRGDFALVWDSVQDGSGAGIYGRRHDASGNPVGAEFLVNTVTAGYQWTPRVDRDLSGRFVVCWESQNADGSSYGIAARRFDPSGNAVGAEFNVNTYTTGGQFSADVAVQANGDFVIVWGEYLGNRDGSSGAVFGQRYDASGNRSGSEFRVNSYTTGAQGQPSVTALPTGGFVVAWESAFGDGSGGAVFARLFDGSGNPTGNDLVVNTYTTGSQRGAQVARDARGNFVVAWHGEGAGDAYGSFAQRFSAAGARRGGEFRVNTYTTDTQSQPSVASDAVGNLFVDWTSRNQDGSSQGVFGQRFGGLTPAALAVDSVGNSVLDPGETVAVRPTWRNFNGAPQTFGGTLSAITGPAGATYAITDAVGGYGTVADGATGQCSDCYAVSVSNPATRPAQHWDASAVETIVPDAHGQQKQWVLHVGRSFTDVTPSGFYPFIEALLHHGVTGGCNATQYCPSSSTTRDQMAVFVLVAKEGTGYVPPACTTPVFNDVPASSPFCRWVEELARRGVVGGCGGGNYCPTGPATRDQMAVFVLRTLDPALNPPACGTPMFADVPASSPFCRWIEELARRGVVSGCGGGNYCPTVAVTREVMSVFLGVTFGLTLYGP